MPRDDAIKKHVLEELLPYRMEAVAILNLALKLRVKYGEAPMKIYADKKLGVGRTSYGVHQPSHRNGAHALSRAAPVSWPLHDK